MKKTLIAGLAASTLVLTLAGVGPVLADSGQHQPINGSIRVDRQLETEYPAMARISIVLYWKARRRGGWSHVAI